VALVQRREHFSHPELCRISRVGDILGELLGNKDPQKAQRAMTAMLQMGKIDIARLKEAAEQG
jgi:hypothetical protein